MWQQNVFRHTPTGQKRKTDLNTYANIIYKRNISNQKEKKMDDSVNGVGIFGSQIEKNQVRTILHTA